MNAAPSELRFSRAPLVWLLTGLLLSGGTSHAISSPQTSQDDIPDATREQVEKLLGHAIDGSVTVRPQAASRLVRLGRPAALILDGRCETYKDLAALGTALIEVLGEFDHPPLREKLWKAVNDLDFPWRPSVARSLAKVPQENEKSSFTQLAGDPLAAVREAAVMSFEKGGRDRIPLLKELLLDQSDRVRRRAAFQLDVWGESGALAFPLEELKRKDVFFERETGQRARYEVANLFRKRVPEAFQYDAGKPHEDPANQAAFATLEAFLKDRAYEEWPKLPPWALAGSATEGDVIGLDLRSCRRGEFLLRWNRSDILHVGSGDAAEVGLPEGTVARLIKEASAVLEELGEERFWGKAGCDLESLIWHPVDGERPLTFQVAKGPEAIRGLRPDALNKVVDMLLKTIPSDLSGDPRLEGLRENVREALLAVGGAFEG